MKARLNTVVDELTILKSERERIASQLAELRRSEREIRKRLGERYMPNFDPLVAVYARRHASYLQQIDSDIAEAAKRAAEFTAKTFSSFKPAWPGRP